MSKYRTIDREIYECRNPIRKEMLKCKMYDIYSAKDLKKCSGCPYLYTHLADHWMSDKAYCKAPVNFKYKSKKIIRTQQKIVS